MSVPNTINFSLSDVLAVTGNDQLSEAFTVAVDSWFDPAYKGAKDRLSNFRNYPYYMSLSNTSMSFADTDSGYSSYEQTQVTLPDGAAPFTVDMSSASWADFDVYASDGVTQVTNSALWASGMYIRIFPSSVNGGVERTGTITVNATGLTGVGISLTQLHGASIVTVRVFDGDWVLTDGYTSGSAGGTSVNFSFRPTNIGILVACYAWADVEKEGGGMTGGMTNGTVRNGTTYNWTITLADTMLGGAPVDVYLSKYPPA